MKELDEMIDQLKELEKAVDSLTPKLEKLNSLMKEVSISAVKITVPQPGK